MATASSARTGVRGVPNTARPSGDTATPSVPITARRSGGTPSSSRRVWRSGRDVLPERCPERLARGSAPCWAQPRGSTPCWSRGSDHPCRKTPRLSAALPRSARRSAPPLGTALTLTMARSPLPLRPPLRPPPRLAGSLPRCGEDSRCGEPDERRSKLLRPPQVWRPPSSRCSERCPIRRCLRCPASRSAAISASIEIAADRSISWST